jgi:predicted aspartyl protease
LVQRSKKLDTGAQCNVLTKRVIDVLAGTILKTAIKRLVTDNGGKIAVVAKTKLRCVVKNDEHEITFNVMNVNLKPILGRKTYRQLRLVMRVDHSRIEEDYDELFLGLGRVKIFTCDNDSSNDKRRSTFSASDRRVIAKGDKVLV